MSRCFLQRLPTVLCFPRLRSLLPVCVCVCVFMWGWKGQYIDISIKGIILHQWNGSIIHFRQFSEFIEETSADCPLLKKEKGMLGGRGEDREAWEWTTKFPPSRQSYSWQPPPLICQKKDLPWCLVKFWKILKRVAALGTQVCIITLGYFWINE